MLFFLDNVINLVFFLIKMSSSLGLPIDAFLHDLMFGQEEVCVELCLLDQTLDGLISGGTGWWFESADLFEDYSFDFFFIFGMGVVELHPAKCLISENLFKRIATLGFIKLARFSIYYCYRMGQWGNFKMDLCFVFNVYFLYDGLYQFYINLTELETFILSIQ